MVLLLLLCENGYSPQQPGSTGYPTQQQNPRYPPAYPGVENAPYPPQQQQNLGYPPAYGTINDLFTRTPQF